MNGRRRIWLARSLTVLALAVARPAFAMTALEFISLQSASDQARILEPIVVSFVRRGHKKVPDWAPLSFEIRKLVLEKGYTYQSLEPVALEAAYRLGMEKF